MGRSSLPSRAYLIGLVRAQGLGQEEAEKAVQALPLRLGDQLTRGQAEDLLARAVDNNRVAVYFKKANLFLRPSCYARSRKWRHSHARFKLSAAGRGHCALPI